VTDDDAARPVPSGARAFGPERHALSRRDATVDLRPTPRRALAICAHPDDADFFVAGTFAKWAADGCDCVYVVCTDGSKGAWDTMSHDGDVAALVAAREAEQRDAAAACGVTTVEFLGLEDGFLQADLALRRQLVEVIRRHRPDVVCTHDPWRAYRLHPDHRACGFAACDAVATAREPRAWPDVGGPAHRPSHLWLFETDHPDHWESVDATLDRKLDALCAHTSQYRTTLGADGPDDVDGVRAFCDRMTRWALQTGAAVNIGAAESFTSVEV
jgi:LmbE family N-acetylglucosaminyl deacetylase